MNEETKTTSRLSFINRFLLRQLHWTGIYPGAIIRADAEGAASQVPDQSLSPCPLTLKEPRKAFRNNG
jgi:hypothetical protein